VLGRAGTPRWDVLQLAAAGAFAVDDVPLDGDADDPVEEGAVALEEPEVEPPEPAPSPPEDEDDEAAERESVR
jgi:hypothetical protein